MDITNWRQLDDRFLSRDGMKRAVRSSACVITVDRAKCPKSSEAS